MIETAIATTLAAQLAKAAQIFRRHEQWHLEKGTHEGRMKADANADVAEECERALAAAADIQNDKGEPT